jgi:glutathione S-transferase
MFAGCGYCRKVMRVMAALGLQIELRDILKSPAYRRELRREGGRGTVPCLRIEYDDQQVEWLYESDVIIRYLKSRGSRLRRQTGDRTIRSDTESDQ